MMLISCSDIQAWLRQPVAPDDAPSSAAVRAHLRDCARCRGAIALLVGALAGGPPGAPQPCDAYELRLAEFAEHEALHGTVAAARHLPDVWWHMLTCDECATVYELLGAALEAERTGELGPPRIAPPRDAALLLTLPRPFLDLALAPALHLGPTRGEPGQPTVIVAEPTVDGAMLTVAVQDQPPDQWTVSVLIDPPPHGGLVLLLGDAAFRAPFDAGSGMAVVRVPAALLAASGGPDMTIAVETPDA